MTRPRLHIIGTGGTIAGVSRSPVRAAQAPALSAYDAGVLTVDALLQGLELSDIRARFDLSCEQLVNIDSKDMNPDVWWRLAKRIHALAQDLAVQGVIITHGTDTLEETSYFIEMLRQSGAFDRAVGMAPLKIIFTAAMRPADAPDADGPQNLVHAIRVAASGSDTQAVLCVLQSRIHHALHISKAHSTEIDAFTSSPAQPLGLVSAEGDVNYCASVNAGTTKPAQTAFPALVQALHRGESIYWPWVALVMSHAGVEALMVSTLVDAGVQGLVIAATGNGSLSKTLIEPLQRARSQGIAVRRASRVWQGGVVAMPGDEFESAGPLSAVKARVQLMLELAESP